MDIVIEYYSSHSGHSPRANELKLDNTIGVGDLNVNKIQSLADLVSNTTCIEVIQYNSTHAG